MYLCIYVLFHILCLCDTLMEAWNVCTYVHMYVHITYADWNQLAKVWVQSWAKLRESGAGTPGSTVQGAVKSTLPLNNFIFCTPFLIYWEYRRLNKYYFFKSMISLRRGHSDYLPWALNNLTKPMGTVGNSHQPSRNLGNSVTLLVEQHTVWFQASDAKWLRPALFWVTTQWVVVISYRRFRTDRLSRNVGKKVPLFAA